MLPDFGLAKSRRQSVGQRIDLGPAQHVIFRHLHGIRRKISERDQNRQASLGRESNHRPSGR